MSGSLLRRIGLRLLPLFQPTREEDRRSRDAFGATLAEQREQLRSDREQLKELRRDVRQLQESVSHVRTEAAQGLAREGERIAEARREIEQTQRDNTRRLQTTVSRHSAFVKGVLRNARHVSDHAVAQQRVITRLERMAASGRPILVGPWTGEVGFELLYWVPFVRWFVEHFGVDPSRLVVVSRGGPVSWYGDLGSRYIDVLEFLNAEHLAEPMKTRKQRRVGERDRRVLQSARARVGGAVSILHPMYVYEMARGYFDGFMGVRSVLDFLRHSRITPPPRTLVPGLPDQYVAAKFYFSAAFPDTPANRLFVDTLLAQIASRWPVVLLDHGIEVDDHSGYGRGRYPDLASLGADITPANNLQVQTAVVGHARAFVGTYGGFSYLAPLCGVSTVAFHSEEEFYLHHRHLADAVFSRLHVPALTVLPTGAAHLIEGLTGLSTAASQSR